VPTLWKCILVAICVTFYQSRSEAASLTVAWDPPSDGMTVGYVLSYGTSPGSYSQTVDVGDATSCALNDLLEGTTYYFVVRAYDAAGNMSDPSGEVSAEPAGEISATIVPSVVPVVPVVTSLSLIADVRGPVSAGNTVTWYAVGAGGVAPYQFQWAFYIADHWTVWPWTSAFAMSWTLSTPGDYQVKVVIRSAGNTDSEGEMSQSVPFTVVRPIAGASICSDNSTVVF